MIVVAQHVFSELWPTKSWVPRVMNINLGAHSAKVELCARASIRLACFAGTCQILVFIVLVFIRAPFYVLLVFIVCVVCLLVVLVKLSLLAKWLARMTPLRKPNRGEGIVSRKPRPKSAQDILGLLYCFIVLLCICVVSCPYVTYFPTVVARYSLFVLKVPLNP